jgi:hypothetical protein
MQGLPVQQTWNGAGGGAMDGSSAPRRNGDSGLGWLCEWFRDLELVNSSRALVKADARGLLAGTGTCGEELHERRRAPRWSSAKKRRRSLGFRWEEHGKTEEGTAISLRA